MDISALLWVFGCALCLFSCTYCTSVSLCNSLGDNVVCVCVGVVVWWVGVGVVVCVCVCVCVGVWVCVCVGEMTKIFYHGICNFISRLRYISRFIIRRVTRFEFVKKRTLQQIGRAHV